MTGESGGIEMQIDDEHPSNREPEIDPEVPEADALEQMQPALPEDEDEEPDTIPPDAPEADALEQSRSLPPEDETGR
jgi:hypothetical protein